MLNINLRSLRFTSVFFDTPTKNYFVNNAQKNPGSLIQQDTLV